MVENETQGKKTKCPGMNCSEGGRRENRKICWELNE